MPYVEGEVLVLAPHGQVSEAVLSVIRPTTVVIGKRNDGVGVMPGCAVMSEQGVQQGTEHAPLRCPCVEYQRGGCVVRKSKTQLPREVGAPRVLSVLINSEGTMVLNTEL